MTQQAKLFGMIYRLIQEMPLFTPTTPDLPFYDELGNGPEHDLRRLHQLYEDCPWDARLEAVYTELIPWINRYSRLARQAHDLCFELGVATGEIDDPGDFQERTTLPGNVLYAARWEPDIDDPDAVIGDANAPASPPSLPLLDIGDDTALDIEADAELGHVAGFEASAELSSVETGAGLSNVAASAPVAGLDINPALTSPAPVHHWRIVAASAVTAMVTALAFVVFTPPHSTPPSEPSEPAELAISDTYQICEPSATVPPVPRERATAHEQFGEGSDDFALLEVRGADNAVAFVSIQRSRPQVLPSRSRVLRLKKGTGIVVGVSSGLTMVFE